MLHFRQVLTGSKMLQCCSRILLQLRPNIISVNRRRCGEAECSTKDACCSSVDTLRDCVVFSFHFWNLRGEDKEAVIPKPSWTKT